MRGPLLALMWAAAASPEHLHFHSTAAFENNAFRELKVTYQNSYCRFVRFSYFFEVRPQQAPSRDMITLLVSPDPAVCRTYAAFVDNPTEEVLDAVKHLASEEQVYFQTRVEHKVAVDRFLHREPEPQTLCIIYHNFGAPRGVSSNLSTYFVRHSYAVKYDLRYLAFHGFLVVFFAGAALLTFYLRWAGRTSQRMQRVLQAIKERHCF